MPTTLPVVDLSAYSLLIFGVDGVLRDTITKSPTPNNENEYVLRPNVKDSFSEISGIEMSRNLNTPKKPLKVAFLSNQGGIDLGIVEMQKSRSLIRECVIDAFSGEFPVFHIGVCTTTDQSDYQRKPNTGLVDDTLRYFAQVPPEEVLIIGNDEDIQMAQKAKMAHMDHQEFFTSTIIDTSLPSNGQFPK